MVYNLHSGPQYHINSVNYDIQDKGVADFLKIGLNGGFKPGLRAGMPFLTNELDNERKAITGYLNNNGYFKFHKDFITYSADSVSGSTDVGITLHLHKFSGGGKSPEVEHTRYKIGDVTYYSNDESNKVPLRQSVLEENTLIEPGAYFNSEALQKTYNRFSRLQIVKYTNIKFNEIPDSDKLNCDIGISTNKINSVIFQPEGTNTAGDFGAAASLTYENKNIFRGAETFSIKLRGAFEAITGLEGYQNQDYEEYSLETKLVFRALSFRSCRVILKSSRLQSQNFLQAIICRTVLNFTAVCFLPDYATAGMMLCASVNTVLTLLTLTISICLGFHGHLRKSILTMLTAVILY